MRRQVFGLPERREGLASLTILFWSAFRHVVIQALRRRLADRARIDLVDDAVQLADLLPRPLDRTFSLVPVLLLEVVARR